MSSSSALKPKNNTPDVSKIMEEIRARVAKDVEANKDRSLSFSPYNAQSDARSQSKAGELLNSEELRFLNQNYAYSHQARQAIDGLTSHRFGPLGKLIVKLKRKFAAVMWDSIFKGYFESEREYQANLVRYLNAMSKYVDNRDASNFWELIRKIDVDTTKALERIERINDEQNGALRTAERGFSDSLHQVGNDLSRLTEKVGAIESQVGVLESVAKGLESIVARNSKQPSAPVEFKEDQSYLLLENRFRGSEEEIGKRVSIYPSLFRKDLGPVLEIGGGRGELQLLFREEGIPSYNVDIDPAMVAAAKEKGLDARLGDGIKHLEELPDRSLGGVIAIQVVEHLPWKVLEHLFSLCTRKVKIGGTVIFETINPRSMAALSSNYFRDPTHIWPLHPDTLSYQMNLAGLKIREIKLLSHVPEEAGIQQVALESYMSPRWADALRSINRNFSRLHELLYGSQDYAVIAEVA